MNNKGETNLKLVVGLVIGIAGLIIGIIIAFTLVSTLNTADLIPNGDVNTFAITNESVTITAATSYATMANSPTSDGYFTSWNASRIMNGSVTSLTNETLVEGTDYKIFSSNGSIANLTVWSQGKARVTYTWTKTDKTSKNAANNLSTNFSSGVDKVSAKIPTVLLVGAIVLILGILAVLVGVWQKMKTGGSL